MTQTSVEPGERDAQRDQSKRDQSLAGSEGLDDAVDLIELPSGHQRRRGWLD